MGTIRLLLALSVIASHAGPFYHFTLLGQTLSVRLFYVISGFYMSLILSEKYIGKGSNKLFYSNRFLRLYPLYWAILLLTILEGVLFPDSALGVYTRYLANGLVLGVSAWATLIVTHITIIGQEAIIFLGIDPSTGSLFFTENYNNTSPRFHQFLLLPQAWTISLEIMFYLVAPFLVRRNAIVVASLIAASLLLRFYMYHFLGLNHDPWTYRFFPLEIALFLTGSLSYNLYVKIKDKNFLADLNTFLVAPILAVLMILLYEWIDIGYYKDAVYVTAFAILLPFIFISTKNIVIDRFAGELSYPVYMCHILVMLALLEMPWHNHMSILTALASILFAYILNILIANPIEKIRRKRVLEHREKNT